jgi:cytochrome o ubiquinol oxidase operon protein cyoD
MSQRESVTVREDETEASIRTYVTGFILSVSLTLVVYLSVVDHILKGTVLTGFIIVLAMVQFVVQMIFFLHLGRENKPRQKLLIMCFMMLIVTILVVGSLWIMNNLNYNMTPKQINTYLENQNGGI